MSGTDMTLNGNIPPVDPTMGEYATMYLKSNEEIVFNYSTSTTEMLHTDWVIEGPTDWRGVSCQAALTTPTHRLLLSCSADWTSLRNWM